MIINVKHMTSKHLELEVLILQQEIEDFYECLQLMPRHTVLGVLSVKSSIKKKKKRLAEVKAELALRNNNK